MNLEHATVVRHAVAAAEQHSALAGHKHTAGEIAGVNEGLEIRLETIGYLAVWGGATTRGRVKQEDESDRQSDGKSLR